MLESVRQQWVHTKHCCSVIHTVIIVLTDLETKYSESLEEMGKSILQRDREDLPKLADIREGK